MIYPNPNDPWSSEARRPIEPFKPSVVWDGDWVVKFLARVCLVGPLTGAFVGEVVCYFTFFDLREASIWGGMFGVCFGFVGAMMMFPLTFWIPILRLWVVTFFGTLIPAVLVAMYFNENPFVGLAVALAGFVVSHFALAGYDMLEKNRKTLE